WPLALNRRCAKLDTPVTLEVSQHVERLSPRPQHAVHQVVTRERMAQHLTQEQALVDLMALLVLLPKRAFGTDLVARGHQAGHGIGSAKDQLFDAHEAASILGELSVERGDVAPKEGDASVTQMSLQRVGSGLLCLRSS